MRRRQKIPSSDRSPLGTRPVETVHVHNDLAAEQATQGRMMAHPDVHEEENLIAARRKSMHHGEESCDEPREILTSGRRDVNQSHAAILRHSHLRRIRAPSAVHHNVVAHLGESRSDLAKSGFEARKVKLRHRHAVQPEHPDPKRLRRFGSRAHESITESGLNARLPQMRREVHVSGTSGDSISIGRWYSNGLVPCVEIQSMMLWSPSRRVTCLLYTSD